MLTNKKIGKLLVLHRSKTDKSKWACKCDCGNLKDIKTDVGFTGTKGDIHYYKLKPLPEQYQRKIGDRCIKYKLDGKWYFTNTTYNIDLIRKLIEDMQKDYAYLYDDNTASI